jgi:hypothetical protein
MKAKRETVAAVIAAGLLLGGGGAAAAGIMHDIPGSGSGHKAGTGDGHPVHVQRPANGRVAGTFERVGGPAQPVTGKTLTVPLSGTVAFARSGHETVTVRVGKEGRFSVRLGPGVYRVSGRTPDIQGEPGNVDATCPLFRPLTVQAGMTAHVTVVCSVP